MRGSVATGSQFATFLIEAFDFLYREGVTSPKMMSIGLHPRVVGHPARASGLERFLDHISKRSDAWICRRAEIAAQWRRKHPPTWRESAPPRA
jgi:allantoinase